jgi:hypothetical protein
MITPWPVAGSRITSQRSPLGLQYNSLDAMVAAFALESFAASKEGAR